MKLYRFSPIENKNQLLEAVKYIHVEGYKLMKRYFSKDLDNAGNIGVFCHYEKEYELLTKIREDLTFPSDNPNQKYFELKEPIKFDRIDDIPETIYTHLYIRKPDPYRHHVGDVDFYLSKVEYSQLKTEAAKSTKYGFRVFPRPDLDMVELFDPDIDVVSYVSTSKMTKKVRIKQN